MSIVLVGLNHHTAPVELREKLSLIQHGQPITLEELQIQSQPHYVDGATLPAERTTPVGTAELEESVMLGTCNRLEIYALAAGDAASGWATIEAFLECSCDITPEDLRPHLYFREGQAAIQHLMRVAAGLDSMILGEPQVLGQVAQAYNTAHEAGTTGPVLSHLFAQAVHAGKRARTETDISRYTTSASHAAVLLARDKVGDLSGAHILVVGAGEMAELALQALQMHGAQNVMCINRTYGRAESLAQQLGGHAFRWQQLDEALIWADLVITATGAPHTVIYAADVAQVLPRREGRPLVFVDVAVPRDVEEAVDDLIGIERYDIDDLELTLDANLAQRQAAVPQVQSIVAAEVANFMDWLHSRQVAPVIVDLRHKAEALADAEVEQTLSRLKGLTHHDQEVIIRMAHRIVNKVLHEPTVRLKAYAAGGNGYGYAHAMRELFALGQQDGWVCAGQQESCEAEGGVCNLQCILQAMHQRGELQ